MQVREFISLLFLILLIGCAADIQQCSVPQKVNDDLPVSSLQAEGFNTDKVLSLISKIQEGVFPGVDGVIIARNNKIVLEEYFNGYDLTKPHLFYSAGKIVTSTVFGLTSDKGLLHTNDKVLKYFEKYYPSVENYSKSKDSITFRNLLTMSTGIDCGTFGDSKTDLNRKMIKSFKPIKVFLDQPMDGNPGKVFEYTDANIEVVSTAVCSSFGNKYADFERDCFFGVLNINGDNYNKGYLPRDFLKIGLLYLNKGKWNGVQVISEKWIKEATSFQIKPNVDESIAEGYGYYWWLKKFKHNDNFVQSYFAAGNGHQYLYVIPELDLVVLFTGSNFDKDFLHLQPHEMLQEYIINALVTNENQHPIFSYK